MPHPLVSVIIPTYNRADFLKLTLESVCNQTYPNIEVIIIDDGTPNDTNLLLCEKFEKVKYIKIENSGGPSKPRNVGILEAKGKYIAFVDDDDLWLPNKLEKQVAVLENNPDFGLVHSCCQVIDEKGIEKKEIIGRPGSLNVKHGDVSMRMIGNWTLMTPSVFISKDVVNRVGLFNEEMPPAGEDAEYWSRSSFETKFYYIDEPLAKYRIHPNNISASKKKYRKLPYYLKEVLVNKKREKRISNQDYKKLITRMCKNVISHIKQHYMLSIKILFELDTFWFIKWRNVKSLMYVVFIK